MSSKSWEVELKFHVDEPEILANKLTEYKFQEVELQQQEDIYLRHPSRNLAQTDEAFRLRRVNLQACVTYKGPRSTGPVKTREEIELAIEAAELDQWLALLIKLGFQPIVPVRKTRRLFHCITIDEYQGIHVAIDCVEQLGGFAEIEIVVTNPSDLDCAEHRVLSLAKLLGLEAKQPRSYLSMLLEK